MNKYLMVILFLVSSISSFSIEKQSQDTSKKVVKDTTTKPVQKIDKKKEKISNQPKQPDVQINKKSWLSIKEIVIYLIVFLFGGLTGVILNKFFNKKQKSFIKKLESQIEELKNENKGLKQSYFNDDKKKSNESQKPLNIQEVKKVELEQQEEESIQIKEWEVKNKLPAVINERILYFPNPNMDGNFRHSEGKDTFLDGASVYKFILKDDNNALIEFCDNKFSVSIALNNRNEMILSLATESNAYNPNATQIQIVGNMKATAQLEGNIWVIKEKAKIKYV